MNKMLKKGLFRYMVYYIRFSLFTKCPAIHDNKICNSLARNLFVWRLAKHSKKAHYATNKTTKRHCSAPLNTELKSLGPLLFVCLVDFVRYWLDTYYRMYSTNRCRDLHMDSSPKRDGKWAWSVSVKTCSIFLLDQSACWNLPKEMQMFSERECSCHVAITLLITGNTSRYVCSLKLQPTVWGIWWWSLCFPETFTGSQCCMPCNY